MNEFTPGPWEYRKYKYSNRSNPIVSYSDGYIAQLFSDESTLAGMISRAPSVVEAEANARLIAAGPDQFDLLAELDAACQGKAGMIYVGEQTARAIRAAIAKVRGES